MPRTAPDWHPLIGALRPALGPLRLRRATRLLGGISASVYQLELASADGTPTQLVIKLPQRETLAAAGECARFEFRTLQALTEFDLGTPVPHLLDEDGRFFGTPGIVLGYLSGSPALRPANLLDALQQMALRLAQIHATPCTPFVTVPLPLRFHTAHQLVHESPSELDQALNEGAVRKALSVVWPQRKRRKECVLHGDYWPGNLLWDNGRLTGVVDWEEAELGDPLADLAVARLDVLWAFGWDAMLSFTEAYFAETRDSADELPVWDLVASLRPMSRLEQWARALPAPPISRADLTTEVLAAGHRLFVNAALDQV